MPTKSQKTLEYCLLALTVTIALGLTVAGVNHHGVPNPWRALLELLEGGACAWYWYLFFKRPAP